MQHINFSVVIPAYNASTFIKDALESVISQTYPFFEIIIVDDGSLDDTAEIAERFLLVHSNIKWQLIRQESNKNVACARNVGIKAGKGEWIAFLDADDIWYENKLHKVVELIGKDNQIDLVCNDEVITKNGKVIQENHYGPFNNSIDILFNSCCLSPSAVCVKREKLIEIGGFVEKKEYFGTEDFDIWIRLAKKSNFFYLHEILGEYRQSDHNLVNNIELNTNNFLNVVNDHYYSFRSEVQDSLKKRYKRRCASILCGAGNRFINKNDYVNSISWYKKGLREDIFYVKGWIMYIYAYIYIVYSKFKGIKK